MSVSFYVQVHTRTHIHTYIHTRTRIDDHTCINTHLHRLVEGIWRLSVVNDGALFSMLMHTSDLGIWEERRDLEGGMEGLSDS